MYNSSSSSRLKASEACSAVRVRNRNARRRSDPSGFSVGRAHVGQRINCVKAICGSPRKAQGMYVASSVACASNFGVKDVQGRVRPGALLTDVNAIIRFIALYLDLLQSSKEIAIRAIGMTSRYLQRRS